VDGLENPERVAALLSALGSENRIRTFDSLYQGTEPKRIAEELDVNRSALQPYFNDFKEQGLIRVEGRTYIFTRKGEHIHQVLMQLDNIETDFTALEEFLRENPEVIPRDVIEEIS
jgi:predicted transcriptional regulator